MSDTLDLNITRGDSFIQSLLWQTSGGDPVDITGFTARMQIRDSSDCGAVRISLTETDGLTLGGTAGTIEIYISPERTATLSQNGVWDIELTNPSANPVTVLTLVGGATVITLDVTR